MVAINRAGSFDGVDPLGAVSGAGVIYPPHWVAVESAIGFNTTATRLYFVPYYFNEIRQFTGLKTRNLGAGDTGDTFRMGVYQATLLSTGLRGGPSSLVADCGEVTLTAAAADRTLATAFTPAYVGWHYLAFHCNQVIGMPRMTGHLEYSAAGEMSGAAMRFAFGLGVALSAIGTSAGFGAYYVDTAYGALASTAVAPTATTNYAPLIAPYLT
jgi:hypothetical protein